MSKTIRRFSLDAMLAAMFVCLSLVSISIGNVMKITLDSLPIIIAALMLGPIDGLIVGLIGSFLNQLLTYGLSITTVLWILPAGIRGLLVGMYSKHNKYTLSQPQLIFITTSTALVVTVLNTIIMYLDSLIFGYPFVTTLFTVILRIVLGIVTMLIFSLYLPPLAKTISFHFKTKKIDYSFQPPPGKLYPNRSMIYHTFNASRGCIIRLILDVIFLIYYFIVFFSSPLLFYKISFFIVSLFLIPEIYYSIKLFQKRNDYDNATYRYAIILSIFRLIPSLCLVFVVSTSFNSFSSIIKSSSRDFILFFLGLSIINILVLLYYIKRRYVFSGEYVPNQSLTNFNVYEF